MSRRKQTLFYCIMAIMTLAVIEGMAQAAYYIAYGEFNGGGPARPYAGVGDGADGAAAAAYQPLEWQINHPYYGYTREATEHVLNRVPRRRREDGVVLIALLGGSVSLGVTPAFAEALESWFRDNDIPLRPVLLGLVNSAIKQPQQVMIIANTLSLGGEYDIIVNLDGRNELVITHLNYFGDGLFPFYPQRWHLQQGFTNAQKVIISRIHTLRQREQRLAALDAAPPWRWSALYGIVNRYLRERTTAQILTLNHELADTQFDAYSLQHYGPILAGDPDAYDLAQMALRVWYRSSVLLHGLSREAGAEYYHFQHPNQYVPNSKPLSDWELANAYDPARASVQLYREAYPMLLRLGEELRRQGINYYDLTQIFADNRETLYIDDCCHLNERGYELLAASMVEHLAPAFRNRAALALMRPGNGSATDGTALDAATAENSPLHAVNKLYFDVRLTDAGALRYSRDDCLASDTAAPFFVRITPVDAADLRPGGAESGYNSYDFSFDRDGGATDAAGQCVVEYQLPEYDIASVLTGQYIPDTGQTLWRARITLDWGFAVERTAAGALRYSRDNCLPAHTTTRFFLHITPADAADLWPARAVYGYDNYDFDFIYSDGITDAAGRCVVERELPDYDIASIRTGQYTATTGRLWETRIDIEQP